MIEAPTFTVARIADERRLYRVIVRRGALRVVLDFEAASSSEAVEMARLELEQAERILSAI